MPTDENDFDIYAGGSSGVFKGAKVGLKECVTKNIQSLIAIRHDDKVTTLGWGNEEETEVLVACGIQGNRSVKVYDTETATFTSSFFCNVGTGSINGIFRYDGAILTAVESGEIKLWRFKEEDEVLIKAGPQLKRMRISDMKKNVIATGGQEHYLQLFDINTQRKIFSEKNLPHDSLQLKVPVWISDLHFLPGTQQIATCGRYGHIRLYDPNAQRRPVIKLEMTNESLATLSTTPQEKQIIVGSGTGKMNLIDLRAPGKILNSYKGFTGGVSGIACTRAPYVVSVSLDRYLRVHDLHKKIPIKQVYLTSKMTCLLLKSNFTLRDDKDNSENQSSIDNTMENGHTNNGKDVASDSDEEYDQMFENMTTIGNKGEKKEVSVGKVRRKKMPGCTSKKLKKSQTVSPS